MRPLYTDPTVPTTYIPTTVGERVRLVAWGGNVRAWMVEGDDGVVVRFTNRGNPVIRFDYSAHIGDEYTVTDTYDCARVVGPDGGLVKRDAVPTGNVVA
jgi:hypothetical protein